MAFLPMVERELRVGARRPATYWIRSAAALCVLFIWLWVTLSSRRLGPASISHNIFTAFGVMALTFCLTAGIFLTSDCLSEEKRDGTLGLLFLTDLRGYDVVLGKLIGTSVRSANNLLAIFPVFALPLLMGGVTRGEFCRVILALVATLLLSLSLGMLVSALNREARQAMSGTFLGLLALGGILPVMWWVGFVLHFAWPAALSLSPSPVHLFRSAFDIYYRTRGGPGDFWTSLLIVISLSIVFLSMASIVLPRVWQEGKVFAVRNPGENGPSFWHGFARWMIRVAQASLHFVLRKAFIAGSSGLLIATVTALFVAMSGLSGEKFNMPWATVVLFAGFGYLGIVMAVRAIRTRGPTPDRKKILEASPFFWLATRDATSSGLTWILILFLTLLWGCFFISSIGWKSRDAFMLCLCTTYAMHQVSKLMFGIEAIRHLSEARRNGNLELLLVSPLGERKIIEGQEEGLRIHFSGVQRFIILINLLMCAAALIFPEELSMSHEDQGLFLELFLGGILMLLLDFRALGAVGMVMALRIPRQNRAILASFARVLCIPWAAIFLLVFLGIGGGLNGMRPGVVFAIWFGIGVVTDLAAGSAARALLARGMRECQETKLPILANPRAPAPALGLAYSDF